MKEELTSMVNARELVHGLLDRVIEMRMRDLERAKSRLDEPDYYFGRAHRCDDIEFWIRDLEARLPAGNPVADEAAWWHKKLHWAIGMPCDGTLEECKRADAVAEGQKSSTLVEKDDYGLKQAMEEADAMAKRALAPQAKEQVGERLLKDASLGLKVLYAIGKSRSFKTVGKVEVPSWGKPVMETCESLIEEIDLFLMRDVKIIQSLRPNGAIAEDQQSSTVCQNTPEGKEQE